jgi:hypothetical protein
VQITVFPVFANDLMHSTTDITINESSPVVGSSQNRIDGLVIISDAKASLLFSP